MFAPELEHQKIFSKIPFVKREPVDSEACETQMELLGVLDSIWWQRWAGNDSQTSSQVPDDRDHRGASEYSLRCPSHPPTPSLILMVSPLKGTKWGLNLLISWNVYKQGGRQPSLWSTGGGGRRVGLGAGGGFTSLEPWSRRTEKQVDMELHLRVYLWRN